MARGHDPDATVATRRENLAAVTDLALVAVATLATLAIAVSYGRQGGPAALRVPLGFLFVFVFPGYAVTSALFPEPTLRMTGDSAAGRTVAVGAVERLALSVGLSIFVVPMLGLGLTLVSWPITLQSVLGAVGTVTLLATVVAAGRRLRRPVHRRWHPPVGTWTTATVDYATASRLHLAVAVLVVLAAGGVGAAVVTTDSGERYTELSLLAPAGEGNSVVADYPTAIERGQPETFAVEIQNREGHATDYTAVVLLQELSGEDRTVSREFALDRIDVRLQAGQRRVVNHEVTPPVAGDDLRLTYLLYPGQVPEDPTRANAYRSVHLNVDVVESSE